MRFETRARLYIHKLRERKQRTRSNEYARRDPSIWQYVSVVYLAAFEIFPVIYSPINVIPGKKTTRDSGSYLITPTNGDRYENVHSIAGHGSRTGSTRFVVKSKKTKKKNQIYIYIYIYRNILNTFLSNYYYF